PRHLDRPLRSKLRTERAEALEVRVHVLGDEAKVRVPDVVRLEIDAARTGPDVLEELEDRTAGEPPERAVEDEAGIADDVADVLDVPPLPQDRLLAEKRGVERNRPSRLSMVKPTWSSPVKRSVIRTRTSARPTRRLRRRGPARPGPRSSRRPARTAGARARVASARGP